MHVDRVTVARALNNVLTVADRFTWVRMGWYLVSDISTLVNPKSVPNYESCFCVLNPLGMMQIFL